MRRVLALLGAAIGCAYGQSTSTGSRTMTGSWDASSALTTKPAKTGTVLPATCSTGEAFFKTDATGGQNLYLCKPDNTWTQVTTGGSSPTLKALVFDGSTIISGETMSAWSCGSGSGASCTTQWTVPSGVTWVWMQVWSGGGGGGGSTAGNRSGTGGSGGGYAQIVCATTPGTSLAVAVGLGGLGLTDGSSAQYGNSGGNSSVGTCITVTGGAAGQNYGGSVGWPGRISGQGNFGYYIGVNMRDPAQSYCTTGALGASASALDQGGCGAGTNSTSGTAGYAGGSGFGGGGGGGGGGYNNATYGTGGTSALGGAGGHGGGWTAGGGLVACAAGAVPGGGGGAAGGATAGNGNQTGCPGGRGEIHLYYIH